MLSVCSVSKASVHVTWNRRNSFGFLWLCYKTDLTSIQTSKRRINIILFSFELVELAEHNYCGLLSAIKPFARDH